MAKYFRIFILDYSKLVRNSKEKLERAYKMGLLFHNKKEGCVKVSAVFDNAIGFVSFSKTEDITKISSHYLTIINPISKAFAAKGNHQKIFDEFTKNRRKDFRLMHNVTILTYKYI